VILLLQAVTRLVTLVVLAALALVGLAVAVFSVPEAESGLVQLADLVGLHLARDEVGSFLDSLETSPSAGEALACVAAVAAGVGLIAGALLSRGERRVQLPSQSSGEETDAEAEDGRLGARRRAVTQMGTALAGRVRDAETLKLRVRPRRRSPGGTLRVKATLRQGGGESDASERIGRELRPLTEAFSLRQRVTTRRAPPERVS
jgi:hypothetical protein